MAAGHRQLDALDQARLAIAVAHRHVEAVATWKWHDTLAANVGLRGETVGDDAAIANAGHDALHFGVIQAQEGGAVEGHVLDELDEGALDRVEIAIVIEMLGIDVGDHRERTVEAQEAAVALIGLDHHPVARAQARVRAIAVDDAAVDDGGIDPAGVEQRRDH